MKLILALSVLGGAAFLPPCGAEPSEAQRQTERALIERDRQAAEFSHPELHELPRPSDAEPLRPDERALRSRERDAWVLQHRAAPAAAPPNAPPLPLPSSVPGGPVPRVDPIPVQGSRG